MRKTPLSRFPKSKTEEEFKREALLRLGISAKTPTDIFESDFGEVKEEERQYAVADGSAELSYSCSVGYRKEEKYEEFNNITKKIETKRREYIDWLPHSGEYSNCSRIYVKNDETKEFEGETQLFRELLKNVGEEKAEELKESASISEATKEEIHRMLKKNASNACERNLPGDQHKDYRYSSTSYIDSTEAYDIPLYTLDYRYGEKSYEVNGFAVKGSIPREECPDDTEAEEMRRDKQMAIFLFSALGACLVSILVSLFFSRSFVLSLIVFCAAAALTVFVNVRKNTLLKQMHLEKQRKKCIALDALLKELGLACLSEEEKRTVEGVNEK